MLVLSRKQRESIFINGSVVVTVLSIRGSQVKLGIEAPPDVHVRRNELDDTREPGMVRNETEKTGGKPK